MMADVVAAAVIEGIREEQFLILPHPKVVDYARSKAADHERWLRGMRKLRRSAREPKTQL